MTSGQLCPVSCWIVRPSLQRQGAAWATLSQGLRPSAAALLRTEPFLQSQQPILVTGGAGFIGSNFILDWLEHETAPVCNLDLLTYAGNQANLASAAHDQRYRLVRGDIADRALIDDLLTELQPRAVVHLAAESHVDRSIVGPEAFLHTNLNGTFHLLEAVRSYWNRLSGEARDGFRFLHVSTDEVYGTLAPGDPAFTETTAYAPNSPYAASKAGSDMLVRAWHETYGLPTIITNCSNNYGPFQFPEKLIPLVLTRALAGEPLPVYGDGQQVRDWLFVRDHTAALRRVLEAGRTGETYNVGGGNQQTNLDVVQKICALLDEMKPESPYTPFAGLIQFVSDRPGHDRRYAIDASKIAAELEWQPSHEFERGLRATVAWYLKHGDWVCDVQNGSYRQWIDRNYSGREAVSRGPIKSAGEVSR